MGKQSDDENGQLHYKRTLNIARAMTYSISRMLKSLPNIWAITGGSVQDKKKVKKKQNCEHDETMALFPMTVSQPQC